MLLVNVYTYVLKLLGNIF